MKTLFGLTFQQLHSLSPEQINDIQTTFAIDQIRGQMSSGSQMQDPDFPIFLKEFLERVEPRVRTLLQTVCDEDYYVKVRSLYDTEERFNLASDMSAVLTSIPVKVQELLAGAVDEPDL
jgi:hypothetical protein